MTTAAEKRILLVEDDDDIADLLELHLTDAGHAVDVVGDGDDGLAQALTEAYDLIVLDIMLPGTDGFDICRRLRQEKCPTPILMVTAKTEEVDKVLGLELGADDYITKPFSIREVLARVKALFRRVEVDQDVHAEADETPIELGKVVVEPEKRKVTVEGEAVDLTSKEFELLLLFARHPGRAFSRDELLDEVWGYQYSGYSHTVNTHINRLRNKIEPDPSEPRYVKTVWGVGYRFAEREELAARDA
ncbi:DNA-binding response OmpR family regulator [Salinibacter ruber]|uniref:Phosphate regulon transcriptional regulatory protein PhoB n=1 Tax=Salinibacter ruber TaxID=146919 RepID=A0A9X2ZUN9_9BACT|nr:response regulator transcription factor [Salinibacter ruber]MCS3662785.1 DNA-binding response OmpR family regulator [Salinibacter ruber]MCS3668252.1 DNA-binding response OmpR family regulator [Salinibacter ruber]MCS3705455.1 DNA-binding response OmpR family regulator [Salinibacter ruber]MCS3830200.1 DNA-binding response OmpR family regulator [Salinibacter ruber]MCS3857149.1 DNA-binding response OmpR family regulator [Salinibacter ruber]